MQEDRMTVLGYVRCSTDEQTDSGAGLQAQRDAIEAECARRGWQLLDVVEDAGYSARNLKRPGIQDALAELKGKRADGLVVAKLDRLSRSMLDFAGLMDRAQREGWALIALDLGIDTTTPAGEAMANVMATFSQFERRLIGQRTREALAVKRAQGVQLGRPRSLSQNVVDRIAREREQGLSLRAIAAGLDRDRIPTAQGGARWGPSTISAVLRAHELGKAAA